MHDALRGAELIEHVEMVDQSPIGKSPRSNPVTYVKAFDGIRDLLASTHQAQIAATRPAPSRSTCPAGPVVGAVVVVPGRHHGRRHCYYNRYNVRHCNWR